MMGTIGVEKKFKFFCPRIGTGKKCGMDFWCRVKNGHADGAKHTKFMLTALLNYNSQDILVISKTVSRILFSITSLSSELICLRKTSMYINLAWEHLSLADTRLITDINQKSRQR